MTVAARTSSIEVVIGKGDVRTIQRGTWAQFEHLQQGFEDTRGVKLSYCDGTIEILMPGVAHELFNSHGSLVVLTIGYHWFLDRRSN